MNNYFVLSITYESFLKLNPIIEKYGFVFESYDYDNLIKNFKSIICFGVEPKNNADIKYYFQLSPMYDGDVIFEKPMIFLKSIESIEARIEKTSLPIQKIIQQDSAFVERLISILRLYKEGMIEKNMEFSYDVETERIGQFNYYVHKRPFLYKEYIIDDGDVAEFERKLDSNIVINELSQLAYDSFMLSYTIDNNKVKYILLMIALESLFNRGNDQIAHTISRHLSLLISETKEIFFENYKIVKGLYTFRNIIVHGASIADVELIQKLSILDQMVRKALNFTISQKMSKKDLFDELNAKGY